MVKNDKLLLIDPAAAKDKSNKAKIEYGEYSINNDEYTTLEPIKENVTKPSCLGSETQSSARLK